MIILALWQVQRAHTKYKLINTTPPVSITEQEIGIDTPDQHHIHYHYPINNQAFFVIEPAISQHKVGIELIVLSEIQHLQQTLAINLGWFANLKEAENALHEQQHQPIEGILMTPRGKLLRQPKNTLSVWPKKLSYIDLKHMANLTQRDMYPKILLTPKATLYQTVASAENLKLGITRHICYALQFIAFAIIGILLSRKLQGKKHDTKL